MWPAKIIDVEDRTASYARFCFGGGCTGKPFSAKGGGGGLHPNLQQKTRFSGRSALITSHPPPPPSFCVPKCEGSFNRNKTNSRRPDDRIILLKIKAYCLASRFLRSAVTEKNPDKTRSQQKRYIPAKLATLALSFKSQILTSESAIPVPKIKPSGWNCAHVIAEKSIGKHYIQRL